MAVPEAPSPLAIDNIEMRKFRYRFSGGNSFGLEVLEYQVGYGQNPTSVQYTVKSWGATTLTGLPPGSVWYVWVRARNSDGWGPWSVRSSVRTVSGARVRYKGQWRYAVPMVRHNGTWKFAEPWIRDKGKWKRTNNV